MNKEHLIYHSGCWTCKRALEDPAEKYICPKYEQHLREYERYEQRNREV